MKENSEKGKFTRSAATGAIALAFLIIGYQTALFIHRAATLKIIADATTPDTVYVVAGPAAGNLTETSPAQRTVSGPLESVKDDGEGLKQVIGRASGKRPEEAKEVIRKFTPRTYENFRFNPNTASIDDLCRLGFSAKQAESIDSYRKKGGRFRRKEDFARSYVVADSVYKRLEPYIDIPLLDINIADSAAFDALPGIGGYFAARMVDYRRRLGGYSFPEQLMDIRNFDQEKFDRLKDLITIGRKADRFRLWDLPVDSLRLHPYVRDYETARAIILYRENNPCSEWTAEGLAKAGIIDNETASKLARCIE